MDKTGLLIRKIFGRQLIAVLAVILVATACIAAPGAFANEAGDSETDTPADTSSDQTSSDQTGSDTTGSDQTSSDTTGSGQTSSDTTSSGPASNPTVSELRESLTDVKNGLDAAKGEYEAAVKELESLESQISILETLIVEAQEQIDTLQGQIAESNERLFVLTQQIVELDNEVYDQNSALNKRLRVMYLTDDQSMLAVVLGSESFVDMMSNLEMVRRIHENDKAFLEDLERKLNDVEEKKAEAEIIENALKDKRAELQAYKNQLDADKVALAAAQSRVKEIRDSAAAEIERLEQESKRIAQELANMISQWGDYGGGAMAWPVMGPVTSEYGMRYHPLSGRYSMHTGIDLGASSGTPIHAAADGIVYYAGWNGGGYGNLVMIDNGSGIVTMYAHCSGFAVSQGTVVQRGDVVAYIGSTGASTGPHLHFEVRVNGSHQNPRGWLG